MELGDAELVGMEVVMLGGLSFQLAAFHPFRPLKALIRSCIERYIHASAGGLEGEIDGPTRTFLSIEDPLFRPQWDLLQASVLQI